ncbi:flagellar biosynthesis protein FlgL [Exiguobacterium sp. Leaf187]|uniref:Flagellar biosynthesis protein FlgL n=1 Tax=Exiguobacterium indicum TaxID=296995 RepID=A0A0V8GIY1_9BACL|nr:MULTISPECIES: flagellar hook-associated protein FlgL [Exiguobacterium]KQS19900.1 flagellar biosynthesis protein FlgL [Exiguobacterium sp. Leaf187]KSU50097.1 flagellar biosynthesis protein FlgL [Exiguobacterium enclense]MCQ4089298.1 flagellar hook-associated protein FlgL [Exiguobacterium sp. LL15]SDB89193.1 flagellar hook-associated protein 3 FlgL [Exiguobacterium enclense]
MRVTQTMLTKTNIGHLSSSYQKLSTLQEQLISGKKIQKPSQDPVVAMQGIRYRTEVREVDQFKKNVDEATGWMDLTDSALDEVTSAMRRINELTTQAANDTYDGTQRKAIQSEVGQLIEHIGTLANTKYNEKQIFNGTQTDQPFINMEELKAFLKDTVNTADVDKIFTETLGTSDGKIEYEVSSGIKVQVNVTPTDGGDGGVFGKDTFTTLKKLFNALGGTKADGSPGSSTNNGTELSGMLKDLTAMLNKTVEVRSDLGARVNRLELNASRLEDQEIIAKTVMSDNEDIETEQVIMELKSHETLHRAALSAGARIIQPSLLDFLR